MVIFESRVELNQKTKAKIAAERQECFLEVTAQGERRVPDSRDCLSPAGVFLVAVSLCSSAVLEQAVVGRALVTLSPVFSTNLESTTLPDVQRTRNKKTCY